MRAIAVHCPRTGHGLPGGQRISAWAKPLRLLGSALTVSMLCGLVTGPANAAVSLRVEARPVSDPIKAYVTVTDADGKPVTGLTAADFTVLVDGTAVSSPSLSQPPAQDLSQRVSVVFVMDYSYSVTQAALVPMQESIIAFVNAMKPGDYAAVVKFNVLNPSKASVVQPFTQIDGGAGTSALIGAVMAPYPGGSANQATVPQTNLFDGVKLAAEQFSIPSTPLPVGPKAIVVASDGDDNASSVTGNSAVDLANQAGVSIFTIGVGNVLAGRPLEILQELASRTGGQYLPAPTSGQISDGYVKVSNLLNNEYVLSFTSSITDCNSHTFEVRVNGQTTPATSAFTRCTAATTPPPSGGGGGSSGGGGGGGATGLLEVLVGLSLLAVRRRRRTV